jgi:hypothetical protein
MMRYEGDGEGMGKWDGEMGWLWRVGVWICGWVEEGGWGGDGSGW